MGAGKLMTGGAEAPVVVVEVVRDAFDGKAKPLTEHTIAPVNAPGAYWLDALNMGAPALSGTGDVMGNPINDHAAVCAEAGAPKRVAARFKLDYVGWGEMAGLLVNYGDAANHVRVYWSNGLVWLEDFVNGQQELRTVPAELKAGEWFALAVALVAGGLVVSLNGEEVMKYTPAVTTAKGGDCGIILRSGMAAVYVDDFVIEA